MRKLFFLIALFAGFFQPAYSQTDWAAIPVITVGDSITDRSGRALITGLVRDVNGAPLNAASVSFDLMKYFDYTDPQGRYVIECPPGEYRVIVRYMGMLPSYLRVRILGNGLLPIQMTEGVIDLETVVISTRARDANVKDALSGVNKLSVPELKVIPTLMGEVDILKALQTLPGVSSVGEGSSAINVRGGRADQNLILVNGAPLFNATHALGFVSGFNQDVLSGFTFYKGNIPANFGGRASAVLDVKFRNGDQSGWKYQGGIGLISSRFTVEGPLDSGRTSLLAAGRISHANWLRGTIDEPSVRNSALGFQDGTVVVGHRFNENSNLNLTLYASHDDFRFSDQFAFSWNNFIASLSWRALANRKASPVTSLSFGRYSNNLIDPGGFSRSVLFNAMNYLKFQEQVNWQQNENNSLTAGVEATLYYPSPEQRKAYQGSATVIPGQVNKNNGLEASVFVQDDITVNEHLSFSTGVRVSGYAHLGPDTIFRYAPNGPRTRETIIGKDVYDRPSVLYKTGGVEPRLSVRWSFGENQSVKAGYSRMIQYIHQISNTASPTPVDLWQVANGYLTPQRSHNLSVGYFRNFDDDMFETSAELFWKSMENLVEYKDFAMLYLNPHIETELVTGKGRAWGGELYLNKRKGWWTGWISYTYTRTDIKVSSPYPGESINSGKWFPSGYNKPHQFNLVINRRFFRRGGISLNTSYSSGRPLTAIETGYISDGVAVPVYSDRNKYRIGHYLRTDLSLTIGKVFRKLDDNLVLSLYNIGGRLNPYSVFYKRADPNIFLPRAYQLSVLGAMLPSITYNFTVK